MTYTSLTTQVTRTPATAAWANQVKSNEDDLNARVTALSAITPAWSGAINSAAPMSVPNATDQVVTFNTGPNVGGMAAAGTASTITIPQDGMYMVTFNAYFSAGTGGTRRVAHVARNGTTAAFFIVSDARPASAVNNELTYPTISQAVPLNATDVLRFYVWQDSGGTITLTGGVTSTLNAPTRASVVYMCPLV